MKLYEINEQIQNLLENGFDTDCIDMETGEILESVATQKLDGLMLNEQDKIENTALFIKNLLSESDAIKAEMDNFQQRKKSKDNKIKWLKNYLSDYMHETKRTKFETSKVALSFRKSESIEIFDAEKLIKQRPEFIKTVVPELNKAEIKKALKAGCNIEGASLVEKQNLQVK